MYKLISYKKQKIEAAQGAVEVSVNFIDLDDLLINISPETTIGEIKQKIAGEKGVGACLLSLFIVLLCVECNVESIFNF